MLRKLGLRVAAGLLATSALGVTALVTAGGASAWDVTIWDKVAFCESTNRWAVNTGNGYYGGLQFSYSTWKEFGGQAYAQYAHQATKAQQIAIARRVLYTQGPVAWPVCSRYAGLTKANGGADPNAMPGGSTSAPTTSTPTTTASQLAAQTPKPIGSTSSNSSSQDSSAMLDVDGELGPLTIEAMQRWVGADPDGEWGPLTSAALQTKVGAQVTGVRDTQTTVKVQKVVGADQDGEWGPQTTSYLQGYLNNL